MAGKLLFISGLTGAGKSTLIEAALSTIDTLEALSTYTTRPQRDGEVNSYGYTFVNDSAYEEVKSQSNKWDETIYGNYRYGADAGKYISGLKSGKNVIVSVTPNRDDIREMSKIYNTQAITIWINTNPKTAHARVASDSIRSARTEDEAVKYEFDVIFEPTGNLDEDAVSFTKLVKGIINEQSS